MVGTQKASYHNRDVDWDENENSRVPALEDEALELHIRELATGQNAPGIARLADCRLDERREIPAALELVLDTHAALCAELLRPLSVDLALEVECALFVSDVPWCNEESEGNPGEEGVPGEETAVVKEYSSPTDDGCKYTYRGSDGAEDELGAVAGADDIGMLPDVEPRQKTDHQRSE